MNDLQMSLSFISFCSLKIKTGEITSVIDEFLYFYLICGESRGRHLKIFLKKIFKKIKKIFSFHPQQKRQSLPIEALSKSLFNPFNLSIFQSFNLFNPYSPIIFLNCPSSIPSIIVLTNSPKSLCPLFPVNLISPCHFPIISPTLTLPPLQAFLTSCLFHS